MCPFDEVDVVTYQPTQVSAASFTCPVSAEGAIVDTSGANVGEDTISVLWSVGERGVLVRATSGTCRKKAMGKYDVVLSYFHILFYMCGLGLHSERRLEFVGRMLYCMWRRQIAGMDYACLRVGYENRRSCTNIVVFRFSIGCPY